MATAPPVESKPGEASPAPVGAPQSTVQGPPLPLVLVPSAGSQPMASRTPEQKLASAPKPPVTANAMPLSYWTNQLDFRFLNLIAPVDEQTGRRLLTPEIRSDRHADAGATANVVDALSKLEVDSHSQLFTGQTLPPGDVAPDSRVILGRIRGSLLGTIVDLSPYADAFKALLFHTPLQRTKVNLGEEGKNDEDKAEKRAKTLQDLRQACLIDAIALFQAAEEGRDRKNPALNTQRRDDLKEAIALGLIGYWDSGVFKYTQAVSGQRAPIPDAWDEMVHRGVDPHNLIDWLGWGVRDFLHGAHLEYMRVKRRVSLHLRWYEAANDYYSENPIRRAKAAGVLKVAHAIHGEGLEEFRRRRDLTPGEREQVMAVHKGWDDWGGQKGDCFGKGNPQAKFGLVYAFMEEFFPLFRDHDGPDPNFHNETPYQRRAAEMIWGRLTNFLHMAQQKGMFGVADGDILGNNAVLSDGTPNLIHSSFRDDKVWDLNIQGVPDLQQSTLDYCSRTWGKMADPWNTRAGRPVKFDEGNPEQRWQMMRGTYIYMHTMYKNFLQRTSSFDVGLRMRNIPHLSVNDSNAGNLLYAVADELAGGSLGFTVDGRSADPDASAAMRRCALALRENTGLVARILASDEWKAVSSPDFVPGGEAERNWRAMFRNAVTGYYGEGTAIAAEESTQRRADWSSTDAMMAERRREHLERLVKNQLSEGDRRLIANQSGLADFDPEVFMHTLICVQDHFVERSNLAIAGALEGTVDEVKTLGLKRTWFEEALLHSAPPGVIEERQFEWGVQLRLAHLFGVVGNDLERLRRNQPNPYDPNPELMLNPGNNAEVEFIRRLRGLLFTPGSPFHSIGVGLSTQAFQVWCKKQGFDPAKPADQDKMAEAKADWKMAEESQTDAAKKFYVWLQLVHANYCSYGDSLAKANTYGGKGPTPRGSELNLIESAVRANQIILHPTAVAVSAVPRTLTLAGTSHATLWANDAEALSVLSSDVYMKRYANLLRQHEGDINATLDDFARSLGISRLNGNRGVFREWVLNYGNGVIHRGAARIMERTLREEEAKRNRGEANGYQQARADYMKSLEEASKKFYAAYEHGAGFAYAPASEDLRVISLNARGGVSCDRGQLLERELRPDIERLRAERTMTSEERLKRRERESRSLNGRSRDRRKSREVRSVYQSALDDYTAAWRISRDESPVDINPLMGFPRRYFNRLGQRFTHRLNPVRVNENSEALAGMAEANYKLSKYGSFPGGWFGMAGVGAAGVGVAALATGGLALVPAAVGLAAGAVADAALLNLGFERFELAESWARRARRVERNRANGWGLADRAGAMAVEDADAARRLEEDAFLSLHKRRVVDFAYANTLIHSADYSWFRVLRRANFTYRWDAAAMRRYRMAAAVLDPASTRYLMHHYESRMNPSQSPVEIFEYERDTARIQDAKRRALRCAGMYCGATRDWADEPVISPTTLDYSASNPGQVDLMKSLDTARLYLYANSSSRGFFGPLLSYISRSSASNFYNYCLSEDGTEALAQAPAAVNYRAAGLLERFALVADPVRRAAALRQAKGQLDQARRKYYEELERLRTRDDLSFGKRDNLLFMIAQTSQRIASVEQKTTAAARETVVDANV